MTRKALVIVNLKLIKVLTWHMAKVGSGEQGVLRDSYF